MKALMLFLLLLFAVALAGCGDTGTGPRTAEADLFGEPIELEGVALDSARWAYPTE